MRLKPVETGPALSQLTWPSHALPSVTCNKASVSPSFSPDRKRILACTPGTSPNSKVARSSWFMRTASPLGWAVSTSLTK